LDPSIPARFPPSGSLSDLPNNSKATSKDARLETDFQYITNNNFRPERGYYHFSTCRYKRLDEYVRTRMEPMPEFRKAENGYLLAEAAVHIGKLDEAAVIMNASARVVRGKLSPLPVNQDSILDAIHYERMVELMVSGFGIQFFQMRKENKLQEGTLLPFPIPGSQLDILRMDYYTFGGKTGVPGFDYSTGGDW
jgi:starch-binding outer membrane protein, SusD/RagB family